MAVLLPFRAFRALPFRAPIIYVPGEEPPPATGTFDYSQDDEPALFMYRQRFRFPGDAEESVRDGIMGLLHRDEATVFPHEETSAERVAACARALNIPGNDPGSLWLWCEDPDAALAHFLAGVPEAKQAEMEVRDRFECLHQIWPVTDAAQIREVQKGLAGRPFFLADGHHRFAAGWNLATIQLRTPALRNLASNRLVLDASQLHLPKTLPVEDPEQYLNAVEAGRARCVVVTTGPLFRGFEVARRVDLYDIGGGDTTPIRWVRDAIAAVQSGTAQAALLFSPITIEQIEADAARRILLPAKSTDFYPKLAAGLVVHRAQKENVVPATAQRPGVLNPSS